MRRSINGLRGLVFILLSLTWGLPASALGFIVYVYHLIFRKIENWGATEGRILIHSKHDFGGVSLGMFIYVGARMDNERTWLHEIGHSTQNIIFGPLFLIVIGVPSILRAALWSQIVKRKPNAGYYDAWFESQANYFGYKFAKRDFERYVGRW